MAPLVLLYLMLAYTDFLYTHFMLRRYGTGIELNPAIKWATKHLGLDFGVMAGIMVPTLVILYFGIDFRPLLETVFFARLMLFFFQVNHLRTELWHLPKQTRFN
jgi:hypothetical protein